MHSVYFDIVLLAHPSTLECYWPPRNKNQIEMFRESQFLSRTMCSIHHFKLVQQGSSTYMCTSILWSITTCVVSNRFTPFQIVGISPNHGWAFIHDSVPKGHTSHFAAARMQASLWNEDFFDLEYPSPSHGSSILNMRAKPCNIPQLAIHTCSITENQNMSSGFDAIQQGISAPDTKKPNPLNVPGSRSNSPNRRT